MTFKCVVFGRSNILHSLIVIVGVVAVCILGLGILSELLLLHLSKLLGELLYGIAGGLRRETLVELLRHHHLRLRLLNHLILGCRNHLLARINLVFVEIGWRIFRHGCRHWHDLHHLLSLGVHNIHGLLLRHQLMVHGDHSLMLLLLMIEPNWSCLRSSLSHSKWCIVLRNWLLHHILRHSLLGYKNQRVY